MGCVLVQLLNCSLENVFKGISCRGIREVWEIFLKLENKNVKFQFLPWSLEVFHQVFRGLVKDAGSGLKRRKDHKNTNIYPGGMGWLFICSKLRRSSYSMVYSINPAPVTVMLGAKISVEEAGTGVFHVKGGTCIIFNPGNVFSH